MLTLWIHLRAFFTVVVVSCADPLNWEQCVRVDQWLLPEIAEGYKMWSGQTHPYENEKDYLTNLSSK